MHLHVHTHLLATNQPKYQYFKGQCYINNNVLLFACWIAGLKLRLNYIILYIISVIQLKLLLRFAIYFMFFFLCSLFFPPRTDKDKIDVYGQYWNTLLPKAKCFLPVHVLKVVIANNRLAPKYRRCLCCVFTLFSINYLLKK